MLCKNSDGKSCSDVRGDHKVSTENLSFGAVMHRYLRERAVFAVPNLFFKGDLREKSGF